jgi:hypothetical protein
LSLTFEFAPGPARGKVQEFPADVLGGKIINRGMAGLQHAFSPAGLSHGLSLKNDPHPPVRGLHPRGPGIIPDRFFGRGGIFLHRFIILNIFFTLSIIP